MSRPVPASVSCLSDDEWGSRWAERGPGSPVKGHGQQREGGCASHTRQVLVDRGVGASHEATRLTCLWFLLL